MPVIMATAPTALCWPMKPWLKTWNISSLSCASRSAFSSATAWEGKQPWWRPWRRFVAEESHGVSRLWDVLADNSFYQLPRLDMFNFSTCFCLFFLSHKHLMTMSVGLSHCSQSSLIDRLVVVDISPAQTSTFTDFRSYIQAMQEVTISSDIPRSTARRMAEDQLRSLVEVSAPRWTVAAFFYEIKPAMFKWRFAF